MVCSSSNYLAWDMPIAIQIGKVVTMEPQRGVGEPRWGDKLTKAKENDQRGDEDYEGVADDNARPLTEYAFEAKLNLRLAPQAHY